MSCPTCKTRGALFCDEHRHTSAPPAPPTPAAHSVHKNTEGGNDYMHCRDCGAQWDYRREPAPATCVPAASDLCSACGFPKSDGYVHPGAMDIACKLDDYLCSTGDTEKVRRILIRDELEAYSASLRAEVARLHEESLIRANEREDRVRELDATRREVARLEKERGELTQLRKDFHNSIERVRKLELELEQSKTALYVNRRSTEAAEKERDELGLGCAQLLQKAEARIRELEGKS